MKFSSRPAASLLWKILAVNVLVIGLVMAVVWVAVDYLAAGYFSVLMKKYGISPTSSHQMFLDSVHHYLLWGSLGAFVLAVALSFFLTRRTLRPLVQMTDLTHQIASGDYSSRVPINSHDEVGRLAEAFNLMVESLQRIEGLRRSLMIDLAHELRTPFTNMQGYLEALVDGVLPPSPENFRILLEETTRLVVLAEDVLRLARSDNARSDLHLSDLKLSEALVKSYRPLAPGFRQKDIKVKARFPKNADLVRADQDKLFQVYGNLLQNALDYTNRGGRVRIRAEREGDAVRMSFSNSGAEISLEDVPFIFERFYRGEKSRSREHGGAGLGLAIVKELVEAHGGRVGAGLEDGLTTIWFSLPVAGPEAESSVLAPATGSSAL